MDEEWLRIRKTGVELRVRLSPRASRAGVHGLYGDRLKVRLTEPPIGGAANEALLRYIARAAGVAPSNAKIVAGHRDRSKTILIECSEPDTVAARLRLQFSAAIDKAVRRT
jgi:uncharacterized protein (TIGR00251 family)